MWSQRAVRRISAAAAATAAMLTAPAHLTDAPHLTDEVVLDAFTATAQDVIRLRHEGTVAVCRLRAGVWEPNRPDAGRFPASVLAESAGGEDRWLDVRAWGSLAPLLEDRLRLCQEKGFEIVMLVDADGPATEPDLDPRVGGAHWRRFEQQLTKVAHAHGLVVTSPRPGLAAGA